MTWRNHRFHSHKIATCEVLRNKQNRCQSINKKSDLHTKAVFETRSQNFGLSTAILDLRYGLEIRRGREHILIFISPASRYLLADIRSGGKVTHTVMSI